MKLSHNHSLTGFGAEQPRGARFGAHDGRVYVCSHNVVLAVDGAAEPEPEEHESLVDFPQGNRSAASFSAARQSRPCWRADFGEFVYDFAILPPVVSDFDDETRQRVLPEGILSHPVIVAAVRGHHARIFRLGGPNSLCGQSLLSLKAFDVAGDDKPAPCFATAWLGECSSSTIDMTGTVVAGYANCFRIFDVGESRETALATLRVPEQWARSDRAQLLKGVHGVIAAAQEHRRFAVGTYDGMIGLFDPNQNSQSGCVLSLRIDGSGSSTEADLHTGVAHMVFAREDQFLFVGTRRSNRIEVFDTRMFDTIRGPSGYFPRASPGNLKRAFDVDSSGSLLATGHGDVGEVLLYDVSSSALLSHQRQNTTTAAAINSCGFRRGSGAALKVVTSAWHRAFGGNADPCGSVDVWDMCP